MPFHKNIISNVGSQIGSFVKENPLLTGVALTAGVAGIAAGITSVRRRRKTAKRAPARRKRTRRASPRKTTRRRVRHVNAHHKPRRAKGRRTSHRRPRHRGHKRVSFVTKDGRKVNFLTKK